ncbi:polysaccharide biosynthesis protein [Psychrosphaera aestuarii]|uniref:polysaccharide biosynthesis protein n=1 Tax=Psychrosphaera aestuarii TaxID=1266052 RepID=UPI001B33F25C|nr:nucleoside-diphosphate sugar epimerase/dehydratase [Psychrosphaera aestuarii]
MDSFWSNIFNSTRTIKRLITVFLDALFIFLAFFGAFATRLEHFDTIYDIEMWLVFSILLPVSLIIFTKLGLYRAILRYVNVQAMWAILTGCFLSFATLVTIEFLSKVGVPRTVPFIYVILCLLLVGGSRMLVKSVVTRRNVDNKTSVIVYGAGSAGRQLALSLENDPTYAVCAYLDDDVSKQNNFIQGIKVYKPSEIDEVIEAYSAKVILLALPSVDRSYRREVLSQLESLPVEIKTVPPMSDIIAGKASLNEFKDVDIEDLLGRDPVAPQQDLMSKNIYKKVVLVSGAGGSIGSELCRQIISQKPEKLLLFELNEFSLYEIDKELKGLGLPEVEIISLIGSVQDKDRVDSILSTFTVDTIYHAAAYKHVPIVEHNVTEGIRNNVFGTLNLASAAITYKVQNFVLISTDKAVRPTNVMGASKRMAELVLQALAHDQSSTVFCMVRFGNVLGSSGSVVPLFRQQIRNGGPVTITHMDITRYFMTIPEASQLVIQAGAMAVGGDVFVLDMGDSVKIVDLAKKMIRFSGLEVKDFKNPNGDIEIKCTGLRPGEKLYEELLIGDNVSGTEHKRILTAQEVMLPWSELEILINKLKEACLNSDQIMLRHILLEAPTAFRPKDDICDLVWRESNRELERAIAESYYDTLPSANYTQAS